MVVKYATAEEVLMDEPLSNDGVLHNIVEVNIIPENGGNVGFEGAFLLEFLVKTLCSVVGAMMMDDDKSVVEVKGEGLSTTWRGEPVVVAGDGGIKVLGHEAHGHGGVPCVPCVLLIIRESKAEDELSHMGIVFDEFRPKSDESLVSDREVVGEIHEVVKVVDIFGVCQAVTHVVVAVLAFCAGAGAKVTIFTVSNFATFPAVAAFPTALFTAFRTTSASLFGSVFAAVADDRMSHFFLEPPLQIAKKKY